MYTQPVPWPDPELLTALVCAHPHALWLDSALSHSEHANQSIVVLQPLRQWEWNPGKEKFNPDHFWEEIRQAMLPPGKTPSSDKFCGGVLGYLSYEAWGGGEKFPLPRKPLDLPPGLFYLVDTALVLDHGSHQAWIFSWGLELDTGQCVEKLARARMDAFINELKWMEAPPPWEGGKTRWLPEMDKSHYLKKIASLKEAILRGDFYQVNFCQKYRIEPVAHPGSLYLQWRRQSPAPQMALWNLGKKMILSASPETLFQMKGSTVHAFPIKGTRPRARNAEFDRDIAKELQRSPKDRAELLMIVDLVRHDLGRVCETGSIAVPRLWELMELPQVHHLVAEITGRLRSDRDGIDLLLSLFPGGSITGAPKLKAMEYIHEMEPFARGIFTGSMGFFGWNGQHHWNIAIRTGLWHRGGLDYFTGGGIVADSDPEREYEECSIKARGLQESL